MLAPLHVLAVCKHVCVLKKPRNDFRTRKGLSAFTLSPEIGLSLPSVWLLLIDRGGRYPKFVINGKIWRVRAEQMNSQGQDVAVDQGEITRVMCFKILDAPYRDEVCRCSRRVGDGQHEVSVLGRRQLHTASN